MLQAPGFPVFFQYPQTCMFPNGVQNSPESQCYNCTFCDPVSFPSLEKQDSIDKALKQYTKSSGNCMFPLVGWVVSINPVVLSPGCILESPGDLIRLTTVSRISEGDLIELVMVRPWHQYFLKAPWGDGNIQPGMRTTALFKGNVSSAWIWLTAHVNRQASQMVKFYSRIVGALRNSRGLCPL